MSIRKVPGSRQVSAKELPNLLALPSTHDHATSARVHCEVRRLSDGRILGIHGDGRGVLYPSYEALNEMLGKVEERARQGGIDISPELLPPVDDFIRDVATHAAGVGAALRVPEQALDRSEESLDVVQKGIRRMPPAKRMTPQVFTPVVAYVGEYMRLQCNGRWAPRGEGNEPMVIAPDGHPFQPYVIVLVDVNERRPKGSLRAAVTGALSAHELYRTGRVRLMPSDILEKGRVSVVRSDILHGRRDRDKN